MQVFQLEVTVGVGAFKVWKRYSEFKDLHAAVSALQFCLPTQDQRLVLQLTKALSYLKLPSLPSSGFGRNLGDEFLAKRQRKLNAWLGEVVTNEDARGSEVLRDWLTQRDDDALALPEQQTAVGLCLLTSSQEDIVVDAGSIFEYRLPLPSPVHLPGSSAATDTEQKYAAAWQFSTNSYDIGFSVSALGSSSTAGSAAQGGGSPASDTPRSELPIIRPTRCKSSSRHIQGSCLLPPPNAGSRSHSVAMASGATLLLPADSPRVPRHSTSMSGGVGAAASATSEGRHSGSSSGMDFDAIAAAAAAVTVRPEEDEPITHVVLRFDNSYSKIRRKIITLRCDVVPQEQAVAAAAAEEAYRTQLKDADDLRSRLRSGNLSTTPAVKPSTQEASVLRSERDRYKAQLAEAHGDLDAARTEAASLRASLESTVAQLRSTQVDLKASRTEAADTKAQVVTSARAADMASDRVRSAMHEVALAQGAATSKQHELEAAQVTIAEMKEELADAEAAAAAQVQQLAALQGEVAALRAAAATHEQTVAALRDGSQVASLQEQLEAATTKNTRTAAVLSKLAAKARSGEEAVDRLGKQKKLLAGEVLSLRAAVEAARGEAAAAQGQAAGASRRADAAEAEAARLQGALSAAQKHCTRLQAEVEAAKQQGSAGGVPATAPAPQTPVSGFDLDALDADLQSASGDRAAVVQVETTEDNPPAAQAEAPPAAPPALLPSQSAPSVGTSTPGVSTATGNLSQFRQGGGRGRGRGVRVLQPQAGQPSGGAKGGSSWLDNFTDAVSSVFVPDLPPSRSLRLAAAARGAAPGAAAPAVGPPAEDLQ